MLKAALDPGLRGRHVLYMHGMRACAPSPLALDPKLAASLWSHTMGEVGLSGREDATLWPRE